MRHHDKVTLRVCPRGTMLETSTNYANTPSQNMQGNLASIPLADVLATLQAVRGTGVLGLRYTDSRFNTNLLFLRGSIGRIMTPFAPRLSDILLSLGVERKQIFGETEGADWAERLARSSVPVDLIQQATIHRVEMGLLPLFNLDQGQFSFEAREGVPVGFVQPGVALDQILQNLAQRSDDLEAAGASHLSPLFAFRLSSDPRQFSARSSSLEELDWQILGKLEQTQVLRDVMQGLALPWDEVALSVLKMERLGLVELDESNQSAFEGGRLLEGSKAPFFVLPDLRDQPFSLGMLRGKKTMLSFFRHAGCPFCNLRVHDLIEQGDRLRAMRVEVVGVFGSPLEHMRAHVGRQNPPFPLLADPDDSIHDLYGCERSLWNALRSHFTPDFIKGWRFGTASGSTINGEFTRLPAEFLIGPDLTVEKVYYGKHASDHIPLEQVEAWARSGETVPQGVTIIGRQKQQQYPQEMQGGER